MSGSESPRARPSKFAGDGDKWREHRVGLDLLDDAGAQFDDSRNSARSDEDSAAMSTGVLAQRQPPGIADGLGFDDQARLCTSHLEDARQRQMSKRSSALTQRARRARRAPGLALPSPPRRTAKPNQQIGGMAPNAPKPVRHCDAQARKAPISPDIRRCLKLCQSGDQRRTWETTTGRLRLLAGIDHCIAVGERNSKGLLAPDCARPSGGEHRIERRPMRRIGRADAHDVRRGALSIAPISA